MQSRLPAEHVCQTTGEKINLWLRGRKPKDDGLIGIMTVPGKNVIPLAT